MAMLVVSASCDAMLQERGNSTKGKEIVEKDKKSVRYKRPLPVKKNEEQALRRSIRQFRLEQDRQTKSLTEDLKEMRECLKDMGCNGDNGRIDGRKSIRRITGMSESKQARNTDLSDIDEDPEPSATTTELKPLNKNKQSFDNTQKLLKESKISSKSDVSLKKDGVESSELAPSQVDDAKRILSENDVVLSLPKTIQGKEKQRETPPARSSRNAASTCRKQHEVDKSSHRKKEAKFSETTETASVTPQKLYRTSKVTHLSLVENGLQGEKGHRKETPSTSQCYSNNHCGSSATPHQLHHSTNTRLSNLHLVQNKASSKLR